MLCLLYLSVDISEIQISWVGRSTSAHCIYSNPLLIGYLGWREEWSIQRHIHHVALIYFQKMLQVLVKHTSKVSICSKSTHSQLIAIPKDCGRSSINQICLYFLVSFIPTSTCLPDKQRERERERERRRRRRERQKKEMTRTFFGRWLDSYICIFWVYMGCEDIAGLWKINSKYYDSYLMMISSNLEHS